MSLLRDAVVKIDLSAFYGKALLPRDPPVKLRESQHDQADTPHYTINQKVKVAHIPRQQEADKKRRQDDVEQENEGVGEERAVLADVVLVGLEEDQRKDDMEREGSHGDEEKPGLEHGGVSGSGEPVGGKGEEGVEREEVGRKGDDEVRFGDLDLDRKSVV